MGPNAGRNRIVEIGRRCFGAHPSTATCSPRAVSACLGGSSLRCLPHHQRPHALGPHTGRCLSGAAPVILADARAPEISAAPRARWLRRGRALERGHAPLRIAVSSWRGSCPTSPAVRQELRADRPSASQSPRSFSSSSHRAANALPERESFTRVAIQSLISDSSQPTARRPSWTGFGKPPSLMY